MIISKLQGGLGNQIFQWAYGKSLSVKYNVPLYLDVSFYQNQYGITKRIFSLDKFPNLEYSIFQGNWNNLIKLIDDFRFKEIKYGGSGIYLDGYWQSEKYFMGVSNTIRESLRTPESKKESFSKNNFSGSVSMHIRRTDYVTSNGYHPVQSIEYYKNALDIIGEYENLYVFSDDINWCKSNLRFKDMTFVQNSEDIDDLWMMSLCDHNIIANSSFSWWGAWLNTNPNKKVISPKRWFGEQTNLNSDDIIPVSWTKI